MKPHNFNVFLKISAFLFPFYLVFYVPPSEAFSKTFNKFIIAGFTFYAIGALILILY